MLSSRIFTCVRSHRTLCTAPTATALGHGKDIAVNKTADATSSFSVEDMPRHQTPPTLPPSIFNDVLGPVMRGPSSSHSAAALRIGRLARDLLRDGGAERVAHCLVEYDPNGSLVTTHDGQGSDMGLFGGLLGWQADDPRLNDFRAEAAAAGLDVTIEYNSYGADHPNMYKLTVSSEHDQPETREMLAVSTGAGMVEVRGVDGQILDEPLVGDCHETLVFLAGAGTAENARAVVAEVLADEPAVWAIRGGSPGGGRDSGGGKTGGGGIVQVKSSAALSDDAAQRLLAATAVCDVRRLSPVLPVMSHASVHQDTPFLSAAAMLEWVREASRRQLEIDIQAGGDSEQANAECDEGTLDALRPKFWEVAAAYEAARGGLEPAAVEDQMLQLVRIWRDAVRDGSSGTQFEDRILPCQTPNFLEAMNADGLVGGGGNVINRIIQYVSAIMEVKSSMGVIVAAPTAGSCAACPGAVLAVADSLPFPDDATRERETARAMLVAGLIGVFIAERATFAAEVGGCMAECGSGSGMAAAAIVQLAGGSIEASLGAASMALQNSFGLVCDPVANRVEAPCLGKNVTAATNALTCANMALARFEHLIPLDEVLAAMDAVGHSIPHELRCTGKGGLAVTPAALAIERKLGGTNAIDRNVKVTC